MDVVDVPTEGDGDDHLATSSTGDSLVRAVVAMGSLPAPLGLRPGQVVAETYRITRRVGAGGMGVVYLARDLRLERDVAIKLHPADASARGVERLLREARAIAQLIHPNVVTVYQVDTYEGHPFVAMEYVDGGTARTWLSRQRRSARDILEFYVGAGRGLAAAHAAGLVHRDFKPDNVLVGLDGRIRVADFGLVRGPGISTPGNAAEPPDTEPTALTRTGAAMGTPAYMAPEQHRGDAVGEAADQFAFAISVWEALTGARPFRGDTVAELRAAQARPPGPPARSIPRHVEAALRRALAAAPAARWPAMAPLLAELARDPRRARRRVLGAAGLGVALLGSIAIASTGGGKASLAPPCAHADDGLAAATALRATIPAGASDLALSRVDDWMSSWRTARVTACEDTHVRRSRSLALLELRNSCLDRARASLEATLRELAQAKEAWVLVDALPRLSECEDLLRLSTSAPLPDDPAARAEIAAVSAIIAEVEVTRTAGRHQEALAAITAVQARADATGRKALIAEARLNEGANWASNERLDRARALYEEAAKLAAEAGDDHLAARAWLQILEYLSAHVQRPAEAALMLPVAEAAVLRAGNPDRLRSRLRGTTGTMAHSRGDLATARAAFEEAVVLHRRVYGENVEYARLLNRLAGLESEQWDLRSARDHLRQAAEVLERNYGPRFRHLGVIWTTAGQLEHRAGDLPAARQLLERALALKEEQNGAASSVLAPTLTALASVMNDLGEYELAEAHARRSIAINSRVLGPTHARVAECTHVLAQIQTSRGDWTAAEATLEAALTIQRAIGAVPPADEMELDLASLQLRAGRLTAARAAIDRARTVAMLGGAESSRMAKVHELDGQVAMAAGHPAAAQDAFRRALAIVVAQRGAEHAEVRRLEALIATGAR